MERNILLTPGPTMIPENVRKALEKPIIHHRTTQFQENIKEAIEGLQYVYQTKNEIYLLTCSGTGGMEAAVANLVSPGDKVITVEGGKFGERWTELARVYGAEPTVIEVEWGHAVDPNQIKEILVQHPDIKAVFVTLNETSTAVVSDIKAIGKVVSATNALLVVDAISGLGVVDCQVDNWGVDVCVSASHKGFMLPPGLAFVSVNDKAYKVIEQATSPRYYFDLRKSKKAFAETDTPFTPAIGLVIALCESLKFFKEKGLQNLFAHYAHLAHGVRSAAEALGLTIFADASCVSNALTPISLPESVNGGKLVKIMRDVHGVTVAGGQGYLKGKIIRIAQMGCVSSDDLIIGITILEQVLAELGYSFTKGAGVNAAKEIFNQKVGV